MAETLEIVSFAAGACRFAVEARHVDALRDDAPEAMVALEDLLGLPALAAARRRCLHLGEHRVGVREPVALRTLPVDCIYPLPELVARRIAIKGVRALVLEADGALLLLDLRALLADASRPASQAVPLKDSSELGAVDELRQDLSRKLDALSAAITDHLSKQPAANA